MRTVDQRSPAPVLAIRDLHVRHDNGSWPLRGISLILEEGVRLAVVGESGCGKSTLIQACLGLLPSSASLSGSIRICGLEVVGAPPRRLRHLRGIVAGYVPQDPLSACDPLRRVGHHVREAWHAHRRRVPQGEVAERLSGLGIPFARAWERAHPHQWSGGMLQRATIAAATALGPSVTLADEPTSALDQELGDEVMASLARTSMSLLFATHDVRLAGRHADLVAVCYAGRVVEQGSAETVLARPRHPYARALVAALPGTGGELPRSTPGSPPGPDRPDLGCAFAPRCGWAEERCLRAMPELVDGLACVVRTP